MRQERLLALTTYLLAHGKTPAGVLARRFEVSARTIYRDVEALSLAGVPVDCDRGAAGGVALLPEYTLTRLPLLEQEREALFMALSTMPAAKFPQAAAALDKLRALFSREKVLDWVHVEFLDFYDQPQEQEYFQAIRSAILERRLISFSYFSLRHEATRRQVEPMKLLFRGQAWYLWGWCRERGDLRMFKLLRIQDLTSHEETFPARDCESLEEFLKRPGVTPQRPLLRMQLRFGPAARRRAAEFFPESMRQEQEDGGILVRYSCPEDEWVYGFLLSFGPDVEVLSPPRLRALMRERTSRAAGIYAGKAREGHPENAELNNDAI